MSLVHLKRFTHHFILMIYKLGLRKRINRLRKKDIISVLFIVTDISKWKSEELYLTMLNHPRFAPQIGVTMRMMEPASEIAHKIIKTEQYLSSMGYEYKELTWTLDTKPDIVIYTEPYEGVIPREHSVYRYFNSLFINIHYSSHLCNLYIDCYSHMNRYAWIDCYENKLTVEEAYKYIGHKRKSIRATGLPIADLLLRSAKTNPWKPQPKGKKKIIWAPHHSLGGMKGESIVYSTFLNIADFMLELAREYKNEIQWAFKPHPLLRGKLNEVWGKEKTDAYFHEWETMENTQLEEGQYIDLFKNSDAMVHDSSSFLLEYLYMNKPTLFLVRNLNNIKKDLNTFGIHALNAHTFAYDKHDINNFIIDVLNGVDKMHEKRNEFFHKFLTPPNNCSACANIIHEILKS